MLIHVSRNDVDAKAVLTFNRKDYRDYIVVTVYVDGEELGSNESALPYTHSYFGLHINSNVLFGLSRILGKDLAGCKIYIGDLSKIERAVEARSSFEFKLHPDSAITTL